MTHSLRYWPLVCAARDKIGYGRLMTLLLLALWKVCITAETITARRNHLLPPRLAYSLPSSWMFSNLFMLNAKKSCSKQEPGCAESLKLDINFIDTFQAVPSLSSPAFRKGFRNLPKGRRWNKNSKPAGGREGVKSPSRRLTSALLLLHVVQSSA